MPFLVPDDLKPRVQGVPTTAFEDPELLEAIQEADDAASSFLELPPDSSLGYKEYVEHHPWYGQGFQFWPYRGPLRRVTSIQVVTQVNNSGGEQGYSLDPEEIQINRDEASAQAQSITLWLQQIPLFSYIKPTLRLAYSAGYDDGTIQADGLSLEAPSRLKTAMRIIVADILRDWLVDMRLDGMTNVYGLSNNGVSITFQRKLPQRSKQVSALPQRAIDILTDFYQAQSVSIADPGPAW